MTAAAVSENPGTLRLGTSLHEYRIEKVLGHGGFGITYLAQDTHLRKSVAIKEYLPAELAVRVGDTTVSVRSEEAQPAFAWGREHFLNEAQLLARFSHPNLVQVYRFFEAHNTAYFVMEYAQGTTLNSLLAERRTLPQSDILRVVAPLLDGLERVHQEGILHRDIKPANIMLKAGGQPVLIDFGAARQSLRSGSKSLLAIASAGYSPIEQYSSGLQQGPWSDIYALGAVAYRAATGQKPSDAVDRVRRDPMPPAASFKETGCSRAFLEVVDWALAVDARDRPQSVPQWRAALESAAKSGARVPKPAGDALPLPVAEPAATEMLPLAMDPDPSLAAVATVATVALPPPLPLQVRRWVRLLTHPRTLMSVGAGVATLLLALLASVDWQSEPPTVATVAESSRLALVQAELDYANRRYALSAAGFEQAIQDAPGLQTDPAVIGRLLDILARDYEAAAPVVRAYPTEAMLDGLAERSGGKGPQGRKAAARMLGELGATDRIDQVGAAIGKLRQAKACEDRLVAVRRLAVLRSPRSLPALREAVGEGRGLAGTFDSLFANGCLRSEAQDAIRDIERLQ